MTNTQARYIVQYNESGSEWIDCVTVLKDGTSGKRVATFKTRHEAEDFAIELCGLMHCGGDPADFQVVLKLGNIIINPAQVSA